MKRIGIFGGTFNPVHVGHLLIAQMAQEKFRLDRVVFVPSNLPPHKTIRQLATGRQRSHMTRLAIRDNPKFAISDYEIKKKGRSYTIDTLRHFHKVFPKGTKLYFIIGGDMFTDLHTWKDIDEILKIATFIVVNRPGYDTRNIGVQHLSMTMPGVDIASSYLRRWIAQGKSIKYLVPESVFRYIGKNKLY